MKHSFCPACARFSHIEEPTLLDDLKRFGFTEARIAEILARNRKSKRQFDCTETTYIRR